MKRQVNPFFVAQVRERESIGGSKPIVEATADAMQSLEAPSIIARIYAPTAIKNFDQDDPRYAGKSNQVENIYLPSRIDPAIPRSGFAQLFNWFLTGKMQ